MVNNWLHRLSYYVLPGSCLVCGLPSDRHLDLCMACEVDLPWLNATCRQCGVPLTIDQSLCGRCQQKPPQFDCCHAGWRYQVPVSSLIHDIKYRQNSQTLRLLCQLLATQLSARYHQQLLPDIIIPTPLHWRRQLTRGFNQAAFIAKHLARELSVPYQSNALRRHRSTVSQSQLNATSRHKNLRGAFSCNQNFNGLAVALVDDIVTTGTTADEISRVLKTAGATEVHIWCLARTPHYG